MILYRNVKTSITNKDKDKIYDNFITQGNQFPIPKVNWESLSAMMTYTKNRVWKKSKETQNTNPQISKRNEKLALSLRLVRKKPQYL